MARKIVVALTGGIAAYKTAELVSRLKKADCEVRVVMTKNACEFITPLTMETLSGYPVAVEMFAERFGEMGGGSHHRACHSEYYRQNSQRYCR